jgi:outer membrane protein
MKKMIKNLALAAVFCFSTAAFASAPPSSNGIAIVNVTQVFQQVPQGQAAFKKFQDNMAPQTKNLQDQQAALSKAAADFQSNQAKLNSTDLAAQQKKLQEQQQAFQKNAIAYQNAAKQQEQQVLTAFSTSMKTAATQIAKSNNYHVVLNSQSSIYNDDAIDITQQVIQSMKKSK